MILRAFNYELIVRKQSNRRESFYKDMKENAEGGLLRAEADLNLHTLLLNQLDKDSTEEEKLGLETAIKNDKRSIKNWNAQLIITNKQ